MNNGTGPAGSAVVSPASINIASLTAGSSQTVHFSATGTYNGLSGAIDFAGNVTSMDCGSYPFQAQVQVPQCETIPPQCNPDQVVELIPTNLPFPAGQSVYKCATLAEGTVTLIKIPVNNNTNVPTVTVTSGCQDCGDQTCTPLTAWTYSNTGWTFQAEPPMYINTITAAPGATGCCVCIHLEDILPVELNGFTAIPGDNAVTLSWSTSSENNNLSFDIERNGALVAQRSASNSPTGSSYSWVDQNVVNGTTYEYTLYSVSMGGIRQELRTVNATPILSASVLNDYALSQNYPNPFNPQHSNHLCN